MKKEEKPTVYQAIGDCAARLYNSWSWGRSEADEQEWAKQICRAVGVAVRKCPLPKTLSEKPIKFTP